MPVSIKKTDGKYRVSTPNEVHAKHTTKAKAQRQANLLRGVEHGWKPTGEPARDTKESVQSQAQALVDKMLSEE